MGTNVEVTLSERGADAARLDLLHRRFLAELRQVDDVDVRAAPSRSAGPPGSAGSADSPGSTVAVEPGTRGLDPATLNALAVAVLGSGGLTALVASVRDWLRRGHEEPRSVRLEIGGDVIELSGATSDEQERLLSVFLARHEAAAG